MAPLIPCSGLHLDIDAFALRLCVFDQKELSLTHTL